MENIGESDGEEVGNEVPDELENDETVEIPVNGTVEADGGAEKGYIK